MTVETPSVSAYKAAQDGQLNVLRTLLLENPNLIRSKGEDGRTLLHHAVKHSSVVELLLVQDRCDVDAKDEAGWTPLHIAASTNQEMTVKLLIAKYADVNATNDSGVTPLCYACSKGYENIVVILLDHGADALLRDKFGRSVFHRAVLKGQLSILKLLFEKVKSASVNQPDADNNTLLHLAVEDENGEIVKFLLLEKHADATYKNKEGKSVSEVASKTFLPYFQRLLENAI
jgi:26S proteasome non-ATPase regulatory subunit 10